MFDDATHFNVCPNCNFVWDNRADFLDDSEVTIIGYQVHFKMLETGLFLFNHSCKGTFSLEVSAFNDLYDGPVFVERATGSDSCPGHCLHESLLEPCPAQCECAYVREIIRLLQK